MSNKKGFIYIFIKALRYFLLSIAFLFITYLILFKIDRYYGHKNISEKSLQTFSESYISISKGDIIFKVSSFLLAQSSNPHLGCIPGHLAISLTDTLVSIDELDFSDIVVAESSLFNIKEKRLDPSAKINSSENNFGYASGRLFLFKNSLTVEQQERLEHFVNSNIGARYNLFAGKEESSSFNCATYVWQALNYAASLDVDSNGGRIVLPADILNYYIDKPNQVILF